MRALVVYESMYGNTHVVAEAIGKGLSSIFETQVVPVGQADGPTVDGVDLLVVGGPTHAHGMASEATREAAVEAAAKPDAGLVLDANAESEGLREWFDNIDHLGMAGAAFDTRRHMAPMLSGRASKGIDKRLKGHGCRRAAKPESFFVEQGSRLEAGEEARAVAWGHQLAEQAAANLV